MSHSALTEIQDADPRLFTAQLVLRPLEDRDAGALALHLSEWDIVKQTATVPFPYDERSALTWIARVRRRHVEGREYAFAITRPGNDELMGVISLSYTSDPVSGRVGEIGYWLGLAHWGQGFASEAVNALTTHGLKALDLDAIEAVVFKENKSSKRVLEKCGYRLISSEVRAFPDRGGRRKVLLFGIGAGVRQKKGFLK